MIAPLTMVAAQEQENYKWEADLRAGITGRLKKK
jgi:hypothetical protein